MYLTFSNPLYLWFLFLVPILIVSHYFFLRKSRSKALIFSNLSALKKMAKSNLITANLTHLIIRCLIIVVLIIGASGATLWVMGDRSEVNLIFALDSSASMTTADVGESRFSTAKLMINEIIDVSPRGADMALLTFAGVTFIQKSFTNERAEILLALEQSEIMRVGGTDLSGAIITATNMFELRPDEGKVLIILSDGLNNRGAFIAGSAVETIQYARENQVVVHSIAIGSEDESPIGYLPEYYDIPSMFSDELLIELSEGTGGSYYRVESLDDVGAVISAMEFESTRAYVNYNLFYWAFVVVFLLLVVEWVLANTYYRRVL